MSHSDELQEITTEATEETAAPKAGCLRRVGCAGALVIWFIVMLFPCFMITLAFQKEISIATGDLPEQRLRLWLVMEPRQEGLGFSSTSVSTHDDQSCMQTNVRFWLWEGNADSSQYCECYLRDSENERWLLQNMNEGVCSALPLADE